MGCSGSGQIGVAPLLAEFAQHLQLAGGSAGAGYCVMAQAALTGQAARARGASLRSAAHPLVSPSVFTSWQKPSKSNRRVSPKAQALSGLCFLPGLLASHGPKRVPRAARIQEVGTGSSS